jgi:acetyltransferase
LFKPESVAVIGASREKGKLGYVIMEMITDFGYEGKVYPINPKADEIFGMKAYPAVTAVGQKIDLAIGSVPASLILKVAEECGKAGVKALVVIASGFKEVGGEGERMQEELSAISRRYSMRIMGPNCEGFVNCHNKLFAVAFRTMFKDNTRPGPVSLISQSGCITGITYSRIQEQGVGFSVAASVGNEVDLKAIDYFEYLAQEPNTGVIAGFLEGVRDGERFMKVMKGVTSKKPVVILKGGRSEASKRAAMSHTGSMVGRDEIVSAAFRQSGVVRVDNLDELMDTVLAFATQPMLKGRGVGIITTGGGLGVHTADLCAQSGFETPELSDSTQDKISKLIGPYTSPRNPVDIGTGWTVEVPAQVAEIVARDEHIDAIVFALTAFADKRIVEALLETIKNLDIPLLVTYTAGQAAGETYFYLLNNGIPVYLSPCRALNGLRGMKEYSEYKEVLS